MIERVDITSIEAFNYLRDQLNISGTLAKFLKSQELESGTVLAYVPHNTPSESLYRFESGGIYPIPERPSKGPVVVPVQNDARPIVINYVLDYLQTNQKNCCLFEEPSARPPDPWVARSEIEYVQLDQEMFYFFSGRPSRASFKEAFDVSEKYYFLCALSSLPTEEQKHFSPFSSVTLEQLNHLANNIFSFFVRAYDGEGYLQWYKGIAKTV